MNNINVNLSPASLDVYGGPASVDVLLDYGTAGIRGSKIFVGNGNPVTQLSGQDVKVGDLFINTLQGDPFYGWLYLYTESVAGPAWETALRLNPSQYSLAIQKAFNSAGVAVTDILISNLTKDLVIDPARFTIRYSIENADSYPISSSFKYQVVEVLESGSTVKYLRITISAVKYSGSTWSNLTDTNKIHFFVSYLA
jgi:hypothetical protein